MTVLPETVPALLAARAAERADRPLLICDDDVLSYEDAAARSAALARGLLGVGAGKRTHVGVLHPNGSEFVIAWLAAARIGAVTIPLSTFSTSNELGTLLRNADVEFLLATPSFRGHDYAAALGETDDTPALRRVVFDIGELDGDGALEATELSVRPVDRLVIVHTSGSTAEPKGVIHQHGPLIEHVRGLNEVRSYTCDDVLFSNSPFFWIGGFAYSLLGTLLAGATLVCSNATSAAATLDLVERTRPTMVNGFAASVAHLANDPSFPDRDLSSIRRGNLWPIMPSDVRAADPELRHNMLGMTETGSVCLASTDEGDQPEARRGSFGKPVPDIEAKIVAGELWLRGPNLMEGYYGRERHETFTPDQWFRTGDLCRVDDDGFHYFLGRRGDMIKTAGANVAPREVEAAIAQVTGLVAHVVGVDDVERGQLVAALVRSSEPLDVDDLRLQLRQRLSAYKVPRKIVVVPDADVPMMSSGKLDVRAVKGLLRDA